MDIETIFNKYPLFVKEIVLDEMQKAGITNQKQAEIILPVLGRAIQVSKSLTEESGYSVTVVSPKTGEVLKHDDNKKFTIKDFIEDFVFEPNLVDNRSTISRTSDSKILAPTGEELDGIAEGTIRVLPPQKSRPVKNAIPASVVEKGRLHKGCPSIEDIASGKVSVDMNK